MKIDRKTSERDWMPRTVETEKRATHGQTDRDTNAETKRKNEIETKREKDM